MHHGYARPVRCPPRVPAPQAGDPGTHPRGRRAAVRGGDRRRGGRVPYPGPGSPAAPGVRGPRGAVPEAWRAGPAGLRRRDRGRDRRAPAGRGTRRAARLGPAGDPGRDAGTAAGRDALRPGQRRRRRAHGGRPRLPRDRGRRRRQRHSQRAVPAAARPPDTHRHFRDAGRAGTDRPGGHRPHPAAGGLARRRSGALGHAGGRAHPHHRHAPAARPMKAGPMKRGLFIWAVAVFAYMVAVFHRTSLSVAGVTAAHRFGINASVLGLLSVAQIAMYAAMQVPVGVLLDRFGSRRLLLTGTSLMAVGQLGFAFTGDVPLAIAARLLIGFGDAMMFISVLRLIAQWLPPRRNPVFVQLTGVLGQSGALLSAGPVVLLLRDAGWTATYLSAAALGLAAFGLIALAVRDRPAGAPAPSAPALAPRAAVRAAWAEPGTRLGLWTHFVTQFSGFTFGLLWGYPFLVEGEGLAPATAALLLSTLNVIMLVGGPVVGHLCGRLPYRRSVLVLGIAGASAAAWTAVLLWPGRAPLWLLVALVVVLAVNGPGAMIGFDYARTFNPARRLGSASGIVNIGGFLASIGVVPRVRRGVDLPPPAAPATPPPSPFRAWRAP